MPYRSEDHVRDIARAPYEDIDETSDERFDRAAFARQALELLRPSRTRVAIYHGATRMRLERGRLCSRASGTQPFYWAMIGIPAKASRRAIALAIAELAGQPRPYALDVLLAPTHE
jgi:hypothetical protein